MSKFVCYAVRTGRQPGLYPTWGECEKQTSGFPAAVFKGFKSRADAEAWLHGNPERPSAVKLKKSRVEKSRELTHVLPARPNEIVVFCDGSCRSNGRPGARAGIGVWFGDDNELNLSKRLDPAVYKPTNNVAEIMAAYSAIQRSASIPSSSPRPIRVVTDSTYVIHAMTRYRTTYIRKNWPPTVANATLLRNLSNLIDENGGLERITFQHVFGHAQTHGNIMADMLATRGADQDV